MLGAGRRESSPRPWITLTVISATLFLAGMDLTVLNVAVPAIRADLLPDNATMLWIVDIYSLTVAALLVTSGSLGDRLGRKRVALSGFAVFGIASAAAGLSTSSGALITSRVFLGIGTALMMASTVAIIRTVFSDDRERAVAIGVWTAAHSVGATVGPIVGGLVLEHAHWGVVFFLNVPVVAIALVIGLRVIPESRDPDPQPWDVIGLLLSIAGIAGIAYSIKQLAESLHAALVALPIGVAGLVLMVVFVVRQLRRPRPLLDLRLFASPRFSIAVVSVLACFGSYVALLFFLAQWFQFSAGLSTLAAGLSMVPLAIANAFGAVSGPSIAQRIGTRPTFAGALLVFALGAIGLGLFASPDVYSSVVGFLLMAGFGAGVIMTLGADAIVATVAPEKAGQAGAIQETTFELSAGLGVALLGTVLAVVYTASFVPPPGVDPAAAQSGARSFSDAASAGAGLPVNAAASLRDAAVASFDSGFTAVTIAMAAVLVAAATLAAVVLRIKDD